uniref:Putative homing endonuclease n=1 Tax=viral metagenome TaxID=1070528 RepID=A0A6M3JU08_9ZZZZ
MAKNYSTKICPNCNQSFTPRSGRQIYCNPSCHEFIPDVHFWPKVKKTAQAGCWEWQGARSSDGYGVCGVYKSYRTHRMAWEIYFGPIPRDMLVLHHCDNPSCVNPSHLFLGSQADNMHDMFNKGRENIVYGESNGHAKLTESDIMDIRKKANTGDSNKILASFYGVCRQHIAKIIARKRWKHIK